MNTFPLGDASLLQMFEACELNPANFRHREHLRLAYLYLTRHPFEDAHAAFKGCLLRLLAHAGAPASSYHETLTRAWLLAVNHFLHRVGMQPSSDQFLASCACLLNKEVMLTHYSAEVLHSPTARQRFVEPDLDPIPRYA